MSASKAFAFSLALLLGAGSQAPAQGVVYDEPMDSETESSGSISGSTAVGSRGGYFWVQGDFGERPAIQGNYATIGGFAPIDFLGSDEQFFIDGSMSINDDTEMGLSAGLGYRKLLDSIGIVGANAFYTLDTSRNGFTYNRASFGAEWLNDYFQLTGNLYVPFDNDTNNVGPLILTKDAMFLNHNLAFENIQHAEVQMKGADLEIGVPIPGAEWLSVHGGAYVWDGKNSEEIKGTRARVQADLTNVLLNLSASKDDYFGTQVNLAATYFFGTQMPSYAPRSKDLYDRMNDRVRRSNRIETRDIIIRPIELAINPRTLLPWTFTHIVNTAAAGGDGSFENQYNALDQANGDGLDAILIHRGDTTRTNLLPGGTGLVLADDQLVFGEGCPTFIDVLNRPGAPCPLPGWATTGTNPFVTSNAATNVFTLADRNLITGLNIVAPTGGNAIAGNGIEDFQIIKINKDIDPTIDTTGAGGGIVLNNATGVGVIRDFGFNIPSAIGPSGIVVTNANTAPLNLSITDGHFLIGGETGIRLSANNAEITATIDNVDNTGSSTGLQLQASNTGDVLANVSDSHFDNTVGAVVGSGDGIALLGNNGEIALNIFNSTALNADRDGLHVDLVNGARGTINANTLDLSSAGDDGIFSTLNNSDLILTGIMVNASGAADDGYDFRLSNGSTLDAALSGSDLSGAGDDGVVGTLASGSNAVVDIATTSIVNAGGNGYFVTTSGTSQFVGTLSDSSLDNAGDNGVRLDTAGTSRSTLFLDNSDATNAGQNGLIATTVGNSRTDIVLTDQSFDGAGLDAFSLNATTNSLILVAGNNVSGANAGDDGVQVAADNSRVEMTWINTGSFAGAGDDGINFVGANNSLIDLFIDGAPSSFNGAGGDGVSGTLTNSTGLLVLQDVTFQNAGGEGIGVTATNSTFHGDVTNGSFNNAGSNGARLTLNNSTGNLVLDNTDLFNAGGDALVVNATNGSGSSVMLLNGIAMDSAGDDAIDLNATDSTVLVTGSQVSGSFATDDAIHLDADNGEIGLILTSVGSFTNPGGDGIDFEGTNASTLNIQLQGFPIAAFDNAGGNGVIGVLTGNSETTLNVTNGSFDNATLEGLGVTATDSIFNGTLFGSSLENAGGNAMRLTLDNSEGNLTLNNVDASGAGGNGLILTADNASTSQLIMANTLSLDDAGFDALHLNANNGSSILAAGSGVSGANAGDNGIDVVATQNSDVVLVLGLTGSFTNAGSDGISMVANDFSSAAVVVSGLNVNFNSAGGDGAEATITNDSEGLLTLSGVNLRDAAGDAIRGTANFDSDLRINLNTVTLDNAGSNAFDLFAANNSLIEVVGTGVSGPNAAGDAILINADDSRVDVNLSATGSFAGAGDDGIDFLGTNGSSVNIVVNGPSSFDGAGDNGVIGELVDSDATLNLTNTTFRNAGTDGLHLDLTSSTLTGSIINSNFSRPGPAPSGDDGIELLLDDSTMTLNFTGTPVDNAGDDAFHIEAINASLLNTKFTGGSLVNAGGDMTEIIFAGGSVVNFNLDPIATGANGNGLLFTGTTGGILNADISNSHMSNAGDPVGMNGILGTLNDATANVRLVNSDIANATLDGINVNAVNNSTFNATLINSQVSNAGGDGLDLTLLNSTSSVTFDNSDLNNAGGDAIRVNGTTSFFNLNLSNGINLDDATGDAMEFNATGSLFLLNGNAAVTANNAGGDGLRVNATLGSVVNGVFNGLDLDEATDNAIDLMATGSSINIQDRDLTTGFSAGGDAIRMAGLNSNITLQLFEAGTFANAGGDGVDITGDNSTIGFRFSGATPGAANLNGANDNGLSVGLTNNSLGQFIVDDFQIQNSGLNGINIGLNNSDILPSTFTNGQVDNNGQDGVAGSRNGLRIVADSGSDVGNRVGNTPGLIFSGVSFQNDVVNPRPQEHGLNVSVDGDSYVGANILNANIRRNDGDGVLLNVNPNASPSDTSLAVLSFDNSFVNNNWGDGFHVRATNGTDDVVPPQTSGAIVNFFNGEINNNGNFINAPPTGIIGDTIGDGIDAIATGDGSVAGNTQITFNLNNSNILGNEELPLNAAMSAGGSVNFNLVGGAINGNLLVPCADGPLAYVEFTLNGTAVSSNSQLILCAKNNGTLIANVGNVDFSGNDGQGIIMLAETGGDITANLFHIDVRNNGNNIVTPIDPSVNPPITTIDAAIQGLVNGVGSTINLTMDEMVVVNNLQGGLDLSVENGGLLDAVITNSNFSDNGASGSFDAIRVDVTGANSIANVSLSNVLADNATDDGLDFEATAGGELNLDMFRVSSQDAALGDGFSFVLDNATGVIDSNNLNVDNAAAGNALNIVADNGSSLDIQNLNNVVGTNAGVDGLHMDILNGSQLLNFNANTLCLHFAGDDAVDVNVTNGSTTPVLVFNDIAGNNAGDNGFILNATDPTVTLDGVTINGATFQDAGNNGVEINIANQPTPTSVQLTNVNANDAGNRGVLIDIANVLGGQSDVILTNVDGNNAGGDDGLEVNVTGLGATDSTVISITGGSSFNNAANEGVDINVDGAVGSTATVTFNGVSANDAAGDGINISPTGGLDLFVPQFDNVTAMNAGGDGLEVIAITPSGLRQFDANNVNVDGAAGNGVLMLAVGPQSGPADIRFDGLEANAAGGTGVLVNLLFVPGASTIDLANVNATGALGSDGVNVFAFMNTGTDSTAITLDTVDVSGAADDGVEIGVFGFGDSTIALTDVIATGALGGDGVDLDVQMAGLGDTTAITLTTVDVSNSFEDGLNVNIDGNGTPGDTTATLALNGLTSVGSDRDGIDISLDNAVTATVTQFDGVIATGNGENGMQIDVENASVLTQFTADGLDLSNNGTSGVGFDGLDVQVHDAGSSAAFDFANLTINNSGGRGIDLDVYDGGTLGFDIDTATISRSGLGGIDLNVGSLDEFGSPVVPGVPGTFTGNWNDVNVSRSGQSLVFTADGINVDVDGAGSSANLVMETVTSNNNDEDGIDIRVDNAANGTFEISDGTTGSNNAGVGLRFNADGLGTIVDLTSDPLGASNVFNNNLGGPGVAINLTNQVTATNLNLAASASGNATDGVQILANDGTGVTINNFSISGTSLQVNNNANDGLHIDFFAVNGVNDFELQNLTVTGNGNDQIFAQFRDMMLDHITLDTITATGVAGSDDGIEISLIDTQLTNAGYSFDVRDVVSTRNGDDGLVLTLSESGPTDLIQTSSMTNGLITGSEFANNGGQGVQLTFAGDSEGSFDIIDNTLGFHNNAAEGILIRVQDQAQFAISGTNLENGAQSMYNNRITNNGGIGFHVVASEPNDVNLIVPDGSGPRVDLDLGDILRNPNTITGNRDAAMAIEMSGDATGSFNMVNSILTNTLNGPSASFNGDGLAFILNNFAELKSLTIDGTAAGLDISNNAGSGLFTSVNQESRLGMSKRMTVINTTIEENGLHGIDIRRNQAGLYGPNAANNQIIIGQTGNGNLIRNNDFDNNGTGNGINIINANMPGGPIPLELDITDNTIVNNFDGIFLRGIGNAQFKGKISDNDFDSNNQDGINVQLENDAALGDPNLVTNTAADPFVMDGNQILNSTRHGVFFDTNSTNESGPFSGGAFVNVLIRDSLTVLDGFGDPVRTLISGNGGDGVRIEDNSDFPGSGVAAQNTYAIRDTDITNNQDGVSMLIAAAGSVVGANNGANLVLGDVASPDQRNVVIQGNRDDGVSVLANTGLASMNFNNITIQLNGAAGDGEGGNGIEVDINIFARTFANFENVDILQNIDDGMDWDITSQAFGTVADVTMFGVNSSQNGERGLDVRLIHDRILIGAANNTIWDIGRGDRLTTADVNRFNQNGREGIVFDSQATSLDQDTVVVLPSGAHVDINDDVFIDGNQVFNVPTFPLRSTNHALVGSPPTAETRIHLIDTVNIINNEIANNGTTFEDGLVLAIGSMTRMNATIAGDSFGGNVGDDIRIYAQRSSELNPPDSVNLNPAVLGGSLPLPQNFYVYDPVAYLDLVFGSVDTNLNGIVDTVLGNGRAATSGAGATGNGDQITVLSFGTNATIPITRDGVYTNADPAKGGAGNLNRRVALAGQVQVDTVFDDETVNDFFQTGTQQIIDNQFFFFNQNFASPYPDPVLP